MIVSISGIDGSGKTSIIEGFRTRLQQMGKPTRYVWLRYNHYLTKVLLVFCRLAGLTRYEYPDGVRVGYHEFYRSRIVSWLFIGLTYIDTLATSVVLVYLPSLFGSKMLVCDRWIIDIMIDLEIDTKINFSEGSRLERLFRGLIPAHSGCYLIMRSKDAVEDCRPENIRDRNFQSRWNLYKDYSRRPWITTIQNSSSVEDSVTALVQHTGINGSK